MSDKEPSELEKAVRTAMMSQYSVSDPNMVHCMIANMGVIGLGPGDRFSDNISLLDDRRAVTFIESGLNNDCFASNVTNTLGMYLFNGTVQDLKLSDGVCSLLVDYDKLPIVEAMFNSNRTYFRTFENHFEQQARIESIRFQMKTPNGLDSRPYLDA